MAQLSKFGVPGAEMPVLMPKLGYRFRVKFLGFAGEAISSLGTLTSQVVTVGRPTLTTEPTTLDVYNSKIKIAGKTSWGDIQLVVRDDVQGNVAGIVSTQLSRQMDHAAQSSALSGSNYKFDMQIETLDGGNDDVKVLDTWTLNGCFLSSVAYGDMDYGSSSDVRITLTIVFDNADYHYGEVADTSESGVLGTGAALRSGGDTATLST